MVTRDQIEALLAGQLDIGLLRPPIGRAELAGLRVSEEPLVVALPQDHPLAAAEAIRPKDLQDEPFVMYSPHDARYFHDLIVSVLEEHGVLPRYAQHLTQIHSILALVRAKVGLAIVPTSATALRYEGVTFRRLATRRERNAELHLVWRKDSDDPLVTRVVDLARTLALEPTP